ncbi:MAG: ABC transporter ATP-binding protein [Bacteroidales bacterium]|nr:ABC transporter ATP-binding protein [Bacteroidales bacterium]
MLDVQNIHKAYAGFQLDGVSFQAENGDYYVILGPSGAGKTLLLEILAGLISPDDGQILIDGRDITDDRIQSRPMGLVFQDLAVFPHMSVRDNIAYPLKIKRIGKKETDQRVMEQADLLEIGHLLSRRPQSLSGGELQRVALARTLVRNPRFLLLDEPLASLDISLKQGLRSLLRKINRSGQTIIHVTHDYEEALVLATKVAVMHDGRIVQMGPADEVFHHPGSEFAARFTGIRNYFPARLYREQERQYAELENGMLLRLITDETEGQGFVLLRGEDVFISLDNLPTSATNQFKGTIIDVSPYPYGFEVLVDIGFPVYARITRESLQSLSLRAGREIWVSFKAANVRFVRV